MDAREPAGARAARRTGHHRLQVDKRKAERATGEDFACVNGVRPEAVVLRAQELLAAANDKLCYCQTHYATISGMHNANIRWRGYGSSGVSAHTCEQAALLIPRTDNRRSHARPT